MRVFTVHTAPPGKMQQTRLLPERFSVWGLLLGPLWLLVHGAWPFALVAAATMVASPPVAWPAVALLTGLCGHDARRAMLAWRGWRLAGVVVGADTELAEMRWFDQQAAGTVR